MTVRVSAVTWDQTLPYLSLIHISLLILPVASARNMAANMREYHFFAVLFSVFSGVMGLLVSFYINIATGPMIVIISAVIFFATFLYRQAAG